MSQLRLKNNRFKFKTLGKSRIVLEESVNYSFINKGKLKDINRNRLDLDRTPISTDRLCAKSPGDGLEARGDRPIQGVSRDFIHTVRFHPVSFKRFVREISSSHSH